jgi:hypothetical protein
VATNKKTGKQYVGLTTTTLEKRKQWHKATAELGGGYSLHRAIRKDGWRAFRWEVVFRTKNLRMLGDRERFYIKKLNTRYPNGYNHTDGGELPDYLTR